jgi:glutamyl-tRNA synthetase
VTALCFAPRPGRPLDLDGAREAVITWLFARRTDGRFLLRHDDTELGRPPDGVGRAVEEDLAWLGLGWDLFARQSDRLPLYAGAAERLKAAGRLYPCFETAAELAAKDRLARSGGKPWIYDRAALAMAPAEMRQRLADGEEPHWRFKLGQVPIAWDDLIAGRVEYHGAELSDPVVIRADGTPLAVFAAVVDDVEFAISHVIRAADRIADAAVQIDIFAALGCAAPRFAHFPPAAAGEASAARRDGFSLAQLRAEGYEPMAVTSLLAQLGGAASIEPRARLEELVAACDLDKFGRSPPRFDPGAIEALNAKLLHLLAYDAVAHRLPEGADAGFWEAVRPLLRRFGDVEPWWRVCRETLAPRRAPGDVAFLARAAELLPTEPFDDGSWDKWIDRLNALTGRKGEAAMAPLRRALTGRDDGPELRLLLPLIGRGRAHARLIGKIA